MRRASIVLLSAAIATTLSCSKAGPTSTPTAAAADYCPLTAGSTWKYDQYSIGGGIGWAGDSCWSRVLGPVTAPDSTACVGVINVHADTILHPPCDSSVSYCLKTDSSLAFYNPTTQQWLRSLSLPLSIGSRWAVYADTFGNYDSMVVEACEVVTVPAGVFQSCYRLREFQGPAAGNPVCFHWYAPNIGPVMDSIAANGSAALMKLRSFHISP